MIPGFETWDMAPVHTDFPFPIYQDLRSYSPFSLLCKRNDRTDKYCNDLRGLIDIVASHHWPLDSILISIFCAISRGFRGAGESKKNRAYFSASLLFQYQETNAGVSFPRLKYRHSDVIKWLSELAKFAKTFLRPFSIQLSFI